MNVLDKYSNITEIDSSKRMSYRGHIIFFVKNGHGTIGYGVIMPNGRFESSYLTTKPVMTLIDGFSKNETIVAPETSTTIVEKIKCDCGHSVNKNLVMSATMGTTCSNCYDEMSD